MEINNGSAVNNQFGLTEDQIIMLQLSDRDIADGKLISQEDLERDGLAWLQPEA